MHFIVILAHSIRAVVSVNLTREQQQWYSPNFFLTFVETPPTMIKSHILIE